MASTNPFWSLVAPLTDHMPHAVSDRLSGRLSHIDHIRLPSNDNIQSTTTTTPKSAWSQASFQDTTFTYNSFKGQNIANLDTNLAPSGNWPLTEKYYSLSPANHDLRCPKWTLWRTILIPTLIIVLPMTFLVAGLLALIFGYRVKSEDSLFDQVSNSDVLGNHAVVLVNYSATRIAFVASWASTLAPLLAGFIMSLTSFQYALHMYHSSVQGQQHDLPTPYQYSVFVGLCMASTSRLWRYFSYSKRDGVIIPTVLRRAARTLAVTVLLACVVFGADTALHYTASTINFDQVTVSAHVHEYGYGLSSECLALNRSANFGNPCSRNLVLAVEDYNGYVTSQNEIFYLQHDTSDTSQILLAAAPNTSVISVSPATAKVALLTPQTANLSPYRDFQAYTTGVSTSCKPISFECTWSSDGPGELYSAFNCSKGFWGVLGKPANVSQTGQIQADSSLPPLAFKPSSALQYAFFMDEDLITPYDSAGSLGPMIPDSKLINPVYFGVAARFQSTAQRAGVNMSTDPGVYQGPTDFLDFTMSCQYTTYEADYTWVNSSAIVNILIPSPNGTQAEIYHGYTLAGSASSFDNNLQDFILEAALQPDARAMATDFANSYSSRVMSVIGPFLSSRSNVLEQTRTPLLVARVPKIPLAILIAGCCCYIISGVVAAFTAWRALRTMDVRDLAFRFSLPALGLHAFGETGIERDAVDAGDTSEHKVFDEKKIKAETMRVAVEGSPRSGFTLRSLV